MHKTLLGIVGMSLVLSVFFSNVYGEENHDKIVKRDLFAVITLQGHPCGSVENYRRLADSDYIATCASGHRYRINVTPQGRVAVTKHEPSGQ